jgi:hypothetical protein
MLTYNTDLEKGACNGATGTVTEIGDAPDGSVEWVNVLLDTTGCSIKLRRTRVEKQIIRGAKHIKKTFWLTLGYSFTAHKSQGATIPGRCVVLCRNAFAPGMLYVMLSRVTTRKNLRIVGLPRPEDFTPMSFQPLPQPTQANQPDAQDTS